MEFFRNFMCFDRSDVVVARQQLSRKIIQFQTAAKMIKDTMDKKFGASWHVVVGEGYGFEITHEVKNLLYMFFGGNVAIILWKCS